MDYFQREFVNMSGKLYTYPDNFRADKIRAVAAISGFKLDVAAEYQHGVTNQTPEFQAKFFGKVRSKSDCYYSFTAPVRKVTIFPRSQLSSLVMLPSVTTLQSLISSETTRPVVARKPPTFSAGPVSPRTPSSPPSPSGSGQLFPLFR